MTDIPDAPFLGWRRAHPKSKWFVVATGATRAECWEAVLHQLRGGGEAMVLESGRRPEQKQTFRTGSR